MVKNYAGFLSWIQSAVWIDLFSYIIYASIPTFKLVVNVS